MNQLPTFNGWTVDARLKQFRKANPKEGMIFLDFNTAEGKQLLAELIDTLNMRKMRKQQDKDLIQQIWS